MMRSRTATTGAPADAFEPWLPDPLDGFEAATLPLGSSPLAGESEVVATLVRRTLAADPARDERRRAVLSLPGWNDYFFHTHVAEFFEAQGFTFYALDPRRSGRSLRDARYRDYVTDLTDVFDEVDAAASLIGRTHRSLTLLAHSTGGLVGSLWAAERPGTVDAVVLNSPWLAMWGPPAYGPALLPPLGALARRDPLTRLRLPDPGERYARHIHADFAGEWSYDRELKASGPVPVRAGWLRAVLLGHRRVARGLGIGVPVFVACSARSLLKLGGASDLARTADIVLDVENIVARAPRLGPHVTIVRVEDGFHDLTLSLPEARARLFAELRTWLRAYVPDAVAL